MINETSMLMNSNTKPIRGILKLYIEAMKATSAPPVGPAISQAGLNIVDFCKNFNNVTSDLIENMLFPVSIIIYLDYSYDFIIKLPTISNIVKKLIFQSDNDSNLLIINHFKKKIRRQFNSSNRKRNFFIYIIPASILYEITLFKMLQLSLSNTTINKKWLLPIVGSLNSMGVSVMYYQNHVNSN